MILLPQGILTSCTYTFSNMYVALAEMRIIFMTLLSHEKQKEIDVFWGIFEVMLLLILSIIQF